MYAKTLVLMTICLLALPSASALSTIGVDVDYDLPLHDGERLDGSASAYVVPEEDGSVSVWQDTNECDGIQQDETDRCGEPDDRVYPEPEEEEEEDEEGPTTDPYPEPEPQPTNSVHG